MVLGCGTTTFRANSFSIGLGFGFGGEIGYGVIGKPSENIASLVVAEFTSTSGEVIVNIAITLSEIIQQFCGVREMLANFML